MKILKNVATLAIVTCIGLTACSSHPPVTSGIGTGKLSTQTNFKDFLQLNNEKLAENLAITDVIIARSNGFLQSNVTLTSFADTSQQLQYKFNWFDAQGFPIENNKSPWKFVELHGKQSASILATAPMTNATTFNVHVRAVPAKAYEY